MTQEKPQTENKSALAERVVEYMPLGATTSIRLTVGMVREFLCTPTKQGHWPNDQQVVKYMMLCKARKLNPWEGDAFLVGYDSQDGPNFSLITAHQALLKRSECPAFDGLQSGVIVKAGEIITERPGDITFDGEILLGGWARCYRKDRSVPYYDAIKLSTFNTSLSRWRKDPAGMIVKVAESSVLRQAFPTQNGGLYTREEMDSTVHQSASQLERVPMPEPMTMTAPATNGNGHADDESSQDEESADDDANQGDAIEEVNQEPATGRKKGKAEQKTLVDTAPHA